MALVKGPFTFKWGANSVSNVSEMSVDYSIDSSDTTTLDGNRYSTQTSQGVTVTLTLLDNDIASLATLLPQYYVANAGVLSTGQTVAQGGAIDVKAAACTVSDVYNQLDVYACGTNAQVLRIPRCRTQIDSIDIADGLRTVTVAFVGEPLAGQATVQFLRDNETFVS